MERIEKAKMKRRFWTSTEQSKVGRPGPFLLTKKQTNEIQSRILGMKSIPSSLWNFFATLACRVKSFCLK